MKTPSFKCYLVNPNLKVEFEVDVEAYKKKFEDWPHISTEDFAYCMTVALNSSYGVSFVGVDGRSIGLSRHNRSDWHIMCVPSK